MTDDRTKRRTVWISAAIVIAGIAVRAWGLDKPFVGDQAIRQTTTALIARNFYEGRSSILYPTIDYAADTRGWVESEFPLVPYLASLVYRVTGESEAVGRGIAVFFAAGTLLLFGSFASRRFTPGVAIGALAFFAFSPLAVRYGRTFMPDAAMLFFTVGAVHFFLRWRIDGAGASSAVVAATCAAAAILVKLPAIYVGLDLLAVTLAVEGWRAFRRPALWGFALAALLPGVLWYSHAYGLYLETGETLGVFGGGAPKLSGPGEWLDPGFYVRILRIQILDVLTLPGAILVGIGVVVALRKGAPYLSLAWAGSALLFLLVAGRAAETRAHYHLVMLPAAALLAGQGAAKVGAVARGLVARLPSAGWRTAVGGGALLAGTTAVVLAAAPGVSLKSVLPGLAFLLVVVGGILAATWTRLRSVLGTESSATLLGGGSALLALPLVFGLYLPGIYRGDRFRHQLDCAEAVRRHVPPGELVVVCSPEPSTDEGRHHFFQQTVVFYYGRFRGWALPEDRHSGASLRELIRKGARYFIRCHDPGFEEDPDLEAYLAENADLLGEDGHWAVYRLKSG